MIWNTKFPLRSVSRPPIPFLINSPFSSFPSHGPKSLMPNIHYTRLPVPRIDGEVAKLPTCCGLVTVTANKLATSHGNGIWETTRHNRHCPRQLVTDLWRTCRLCCGRVVDLLRGSRQLNVTHLLRGNWCNGFWPQCSEGVCKLPR